jgi:hypothetical protein
MDRKSIVILSVCLGCCVVAAVGEKDVPAQTPDGGDTNLTTVVYGTNGSTAAPAAPVAPPV